MWCGHRVPANPDAKAHCPLCEESLVAKCGDIKIWHWAHRAHKDCDHFKESETAWHRQWKDVFPEDCQEVIIKKHGDIHFADVLTDCQMVIEFQHSSLDFTNIRKREVFYDFMIWVFDIKSSVERIEHIGQQEISWWNPRRDFFKCKKPVFLDAGRLIYKVLEIVDKEFDGQIPTYIIKVQSRGRDSFIEELTSIPESLLVACPKKPVKIIHYGACVALRDSKATQCSKTYWPWENEERCQQWRYPFTSSVMFPAGQTPF